MKAKEKIQQAAVGVLVDRILKYIDKDPEKNFLKIVDTVTTLGGRVFPEKYVEAIRKGARDPENVWRQFGLNIIKDTDHDTLKKVGIALGLGAGFTGTKAVRENREKYGCNIPWIILFDPTSACNLKCKGCWSAEYGHKQSLTNEEMASIVSQGKAMGTHVYMLTGGEPLIRKNDIIELCENNPDCVFLAYTNATLVDQKFCEDMKRVGNLSLAISIEGTEETNDARRGEGVYQKSIAAMDLLKKNGCIFGMSVCYTSANVETVTSEEFIDLMISKGVKFGFYFNYMPVGSGAVPELIPTPKQREHMYAWMKQMRDPHKGKPIFVFDFQDDAEYVGGCIAGGRNYFHINSAGDIEPCVFIHYSDSNIRTHTLIEALKNPLFQAYYKNQPFNDNHLRPCPMLENPEYLRKMVKETGAKSTDLVCPEDVDVLCAKCEKFAKAWAPEAERIWASRPHPKPKTQYYRDTPEGKAEAAAKAAEQEKQD